MTAREKRIERAQTRVIFTCPFFSPAVARLPVVWDSSLPTAATDGQVIRWNPDWFDKLPDAVLPTVLCHEACHCLLGHLWRAPEGADWDTWNQSADHCVNLMLGDFGKELAGKGLADPFPFPKPRDAYCADPRFRGMAEEAVYKELSKNPRAKSMPSFGQILKPNGKSGGKAAQRALQNGWENTLIQAAKIAQQQGRLPGNLERLVGELVHPHVPWWEILASWLRERASEDWNFQVPDLTFENSGFLMPSLESDRMGAVAFATDTSGSIDGDISTKFQSVKQDFLDNMRPRRLVDIYCDSAIHKVAYYVPGDTIGKDAPGGGGTSFVPVFSHLETLGEPVKALVYLTDGLGDFPAKAPEWPILWLTWTKNMKAPFGEVIYVGE